MAGPNNELRFIREVIYDLKRDYGGPVEIYQDVVGDTNVWTGVKNVTKNKWTVARAIRLPRNIHRDSIYHITGNRIFAYGNIIETADRQVIIDWRDLPTGFQFKEENWYMIIDGQRYEVVRVIEFDFNAAIYVILKQTMGQPREAIVEPTVRTNITVTPDAETS